MTPHRDLRALVISLLALAGCAAQPVGVIRLALGTEALPDGIDRMSLLLEAPDLGITELPIDPDAATFEATVPAGPDRTLTFVAEHDDVAPVPWYWGTTRFAVREGEVVDVVLPAVAAGRLEPVVRLAGVPVPNATVTTVLSAPAPDLPDRFDDVTDVAGRASRVLPAGACELQATAVIDGVDHALGAEGLVVMVGQGRVVEVPLALLPLEDGLVDHLELDVGGVRVGEVADLVVRAVDAAGAVAEGFDGRVSFGAALADVVSLPAPYTFVPDVDHGEHRFAGGLAGLGAALSLTITVTVDGAPALVASRAVDVLDPADTIGDAVRLVLTLAAPLRGGLLAEPIDVVVTALDDAGRIASRARGTVTFADSDLALLGVPPDATFSASDAGVLRIARGVLALVPVGTAVLRVRDVEEASLRGELAITIE